MDPYLDTRIPMDSIRLRNMQFYAYHGLMSSEKEVGQRFEVDLEVKGDWNNAGESDNIDDTVNYEVLYQIVGEIVTGRRFNLLEALAQEICSQIFIKVDLIKKITISIRKPNVPIKGILDYVEVEIERDRE